LDGDEDVLDRFGDAPEGDGSLGTGITTDAEGLLLSKIGRTDFKTEWDTLKFSNISKISP